MFNAVFRLGFYEVYCIVISLFGSQTMAMAKSGGSVEASHIWRHSVTTAVAASILAKRVEVIEAAAFTAGLLHDVGKLVFASVEGDTYAAVLRKSGDFGPALAAAEEAAFGSSHAALGARLLARWGLPENVCLAVRHHHHKPGAAAPFQRLAAAVQLANCLAHQMDSPATAPEAVGNDPDAMASLELAATDVPTVIEQTQEALEQVQGLFQMQA